MRGIARLDEPVWRLGVWVVSAWWCTTASAADVTAVITHGYSTSGEKGAWLEGMGEAMLARAGAGGAILRYRADSGAWQLVSGAPHESASVVLIFRWLDDFEKQGVNDGFAEAAGDALYAALRDPVFVDQSNQPIPAFDLVLGRHLHLLSHSRGTCVNSEAAERLAVEGIPIDHVTMFDPHPMNGTLDPPIDFDWGDPVPRRWSNIAFADNYWRADGGGFDAFDPDGIPIDFAHNINLDEDALECCGYSGAHSDTHLWYHGTIDLSPNPCDGEECISDTARNTWWTIDLPRETSGFHYSILGGGAADRPDLPPGEPPGPVESIFNGSFDGQRLAGWLYHGGSLDASVVSQDGEQFLRLSPGDGVRAVHNRFLLPMRAARVRLDARVVAGSGDDVIQLSLIDRDGAATIIGDVPAEAAGAWQRDLSFAIPTNLPRESAYRPRIELVDAAGGGIGATIGVDNLAIVESDAPTVTAIDILRGTIINGGIEQIESSDDVHLRTRSGFGQTFIDLHSMDLQVAADAGGPVAGTFDLAIESRLDQPAGTAQIRLLNHGTNQYDMVDSHALGNADATRVISNLAGPTYVGADGSISLRIRHLVFVPIFAFRFDSFFDLIEFTID
jgi:hypothetical protein